MSLNALSSKYMFRRSCNMLCCSLAPHTNEQKRSQCSRLPSVSSGGGPIMETSAMCALPPLDKTRQPDHARVRVLRGAHINTHAIPYTV